jgi:hypothetical protein
LEAASGKQMLATQFVGRCIAGRERDPADKNKANFREIPDPFFFQGSFEAATKFVNGTNPIPGRGHRVSFGFMIACCFRDFRDADFKSLK